MARFLAGRPVNLAHKFLDDETVLTPGSVTVTILPDGSTTPAVTPGAATNASGTWSFAAGILPEGVYTVRWDGGATAVDVETIEVFGNILFTLPDAREYDPDLTVAKFPTLKLRHYREVVAQEFERITNRSFVLRTRRIRLELDGSDCVVLPVRDALTLVAFTDSAGVAVTATTVTLDPDGILCGLADLACGIYYATVRYGFTAVPSDVERAGILRLHSLLMAETSRINDRATSFQVVDGGTYTLATAGRAGYETGIPDVDAVLARYTYRLIADIAGGLS